MKTVILFYRRWISPLLPRACRFHPTCSAYALESFERYSWSRAFWLSLNRLLRCHPYCKGGFDPVPPSPGLRPSSPQGGRG